MANPEKNPADRRSVDASGLEGFRWGKLFAGGGFFLAITFGVFWYQFRGADGVNDIPTLRGLRWEYLFLILLFLPCETVLSATRMWMICRVLQPEVSFGTCIKAELANAGMAILTPSQTGGGPGQMYLLNRGGVKLGTALTISLLTFVGTMVALMGMGVCTLIATGGDRRSPLFAGAALTLMSIAALIIFSAACPGVFRKAISGVSRLYRRVTRGSYPLEEWRPAGDSVVGPPADRMGPLASRLVQIIYTYRNDLVRFLRNGKTVFLFACLLSGLFFFSRFITAFLCVRFLGLENSALGEIVRRQMALIFVTYLGPTPGSAGIAEGASLAIMTGIVPKGYAPYYNLLWRFSTVYVAASTGLVLLAVSISRDLRAIHRRGRRANPPALPQPVDTPER